MNKENASFRYEMKPTGFQIEKSVRVEQPREKREAQTSAGFLMEMDER